MGYINTTTERLRALRMAELEAIEQANREKAERLAAAREGDKAHPAATSAGDADPPLLSTPACAGAGIADRGVVADAPASDLGDHHPQTRCASGTSATPSEEEGASSAALREAQHEPSSLRQPIGIAFARPAEAPACAGDRDGPVEAGSHGEGRTIFDTRAQAAFLDQLSHSGNVRLACKAAGVSPQTAYRARRRSRGLALAWDAALLAARVVAEEALASRALDGVEVPVFYHGEEVAVRRCYSDRLLLAHLARLDKLAERAEAQAELAQLDDRIDALREGEELPEPAPVEEGADGPGGNSANNPVPSVPPCRNCGGACLDPQAVLTEADCEWLGNRRSRMYAARPRGALKPWQHPCGDPDGAIEWAQLLAFEAGEEEWWLVMPEGAEPEEEAAEERDEDEEL